MITTGKPGYKALRFPPLVVLAVFCMIFYIFLGYYSGGALEKAQNAVALERIMLLRAGFCLFFCGLLALVGYRISGKVWPAAAVHTMAVSGMMAMEMGWQQMVQDWDLTLAMLGAVALFTLFAGLGTKFYMLGRRQLPQKRR